MSSSFAADPTAVRGAITPLVTPFTEDGALDLARSSPSSTGSSSMARTASRSAARPASRRHRRSPSASPSCALPPRRSPGAFPSSPATGSALMDETLELTAEAQRLGAASALVVTPYYGRAQQEGLFRWYSRVASEFPDLPIIVYNVPVRAAVDIAPETVGRLRRAHDNIVGIKETTRDFEHVSYVLHEAGTRLHRPVGHRAALLPDAVPRRRRPSQLRGELRPATGRRALRRVRRRRPRAGPCPALRPAPARRCRVRGDQSRPREVGHGAARPACLRPSTRAARTARRRLAGARPRIPCGELAHRAASCRQLVAAAPASCSSRHARKLSTVFSLWARAFASIRSALGAALDELDELSVLRDRLRPAIRDVREHGPADGIQPPLDLAHHLDQRRVRTTVVEHLVELAVVTPEREGVHAPHRGGHVVRRPAQAGEVSLLQASGSEGGRVPLEHREHRQLVPRRPRDPPARPARRRWAGRRRGPPPPGGGWPREPARPRPRAQRRGRRSRRDNRARTSRRGSARGSSRRRAAASSRGARTVPEPCERISYLIGYPGSGATRWRRMMTVTCDTAANTKAGSSTSKGVLSQAPPDRATAVGADRAL